jgi:TRAP-type C4-dicarboxylate transport system permease small subunit
MQSKLRAYLKTAIELCLLGTAGVSLSFMVLWVIVDILGRFLFRLPLPGTDEIVSMFMILLVLLPIGYVQYKKEHLRVEVAIDRVRSTRRWMIETITSFVSWVVWMIGAYALFLEVLRLYRLSETTFGTFGLPLWPFYLCALIGFVTLIVQLFLDFLNSFRSCFVKDNVRSDRISS